MKEFLDYGDVVRCYTYVGGACSQVLKMRRLNSSTLDIRSPSLLEIFYILLSLSKYTTNLFFIIEIIEILKHFVNRHLGSTLLR